MLNDVMRLIKTCPSGKSINIHLSALETFLIHLVSMYYFSVLGYELKTAVIASCTYTYMMPHTMQCYKNSAYMLSFSKGPEDIFVLFRMVQC